MDAVKIPASLKLALQNRTLVPFVGAGSSLSVLNKVTGRSLFPSFSQLFHAAADELEREQKTSAASAIRASLDYMEEDSFIRAGKIAQKEMGKPQWEQFLKQHLDPEQSDSDPESMDIAKTVWQLGSKLVVTMNYDKVLDWSCPAHWQDDLIHWSTETSFDRMRALGVAFQHPTVWHLNGQIGDVDKAIMSPYEDRGGLSGLSSLLSTRSLLFIGFGFSDIVFNQQLKLSEGNGRKHYALIHARQQQAIDDLELPLETLVFDNYSDLPAILLQLASFVEDDKPAANSTESTQTRITALVQTTQQNPKQAARLTEFIEQQASLITVNVAQLSDKLAGVQVISELVTIVDAVNYQAVFAAINPLLAVVRAKRLPLLIYLANPVTPEALAKIEKTIMQSLPDISFLLKIADSDKQFSAYYAQIQAGIEFQKTVPVVRFKRLTLQNIGVYQTLDIEFRERATVIIGLNGAGKTTILKALTLAVLGPDNAKIDQSMAGSLLRITGKKDKQTIWDKQAQITLVATKNGKPYENTITLRYNPATEMIEAQGSRFEALFFGDHQLINLILGIGEQRNSSINKQQSNGLEQFHPKVRDLLPIIRGEEISCIGHFKDWIGNLELAALNGKTGQRRLINVTFAIFAALMKESIHFAGLTQIDPLELWVEHQEPKQLVPLQLASQGYQAVMGWVGFIVKRMFEAYERALEPLQQPAIIFIDEIDQLLHVKWQQQILNILADTFFPNTQWIVTTHSPVVVAELEQDQVIQLLPKNGVMVAEHNEVDLWLWQYGDVVKYLFGVVPIEPKVYESQISADIANIKHQDTATQPLTSEQQQQLQKLEDQLSKVQKSRAFVDKVYKEQQNLRAREQELKALIETLNQQNQQG